MTNIYERVKTALDTLAPSVPHSVAPYKGSLPDLFIVYQEINDAPEQHADGAETERSYLMQVTIWNRAGVVSLPNVTAAMTAAGFRASSGRPLPQDLQTGHYGYAKDFMYL
jgi:hypothetical protein